MRASAVGRYLAAALAIFLAAAVIVTALVLRTPDRIVSLGDGKSPIGAVHFGGPDRPAGALSSLLAARIRATPPGASIDWATYYFRDRDLANALIAASERGVHVKLVVDGDPRLDTANDAALALLKAHGLRGGLTIRPALPFPLDAISGRLHVKIYTFSYPAPVAFIGSFNPSGDDATDRATLQEIGDQDRGHNMLVELTGPATVDLLVRHVDDLASAGGSIDRFVPSQNRLYRDGDSDLFFYPRLRPYVVEKAVDELGTGDRLWAAISHLKGGMVDRIASAARRGAGIHLLVHETERRVPQAEVRELLDAGATVHRYRHPQGLPMHAKFVVMERRGVRTSFVGSLNYNRSSRWLNDEVLLRTTNPALTATLLARFGQIDREVAGQGASRKETRTP